MISFHSARLGVNLANMLHEQRKDLTPVAGTLLAELSRHSASALPAEVARSSEPDALMNFIAQSSDLVTSANGQGQTVYLPNAHDALLDDCVDQLSKLVSSHVQYARSVVYPQVQALAQIVRESLLSAGGVQPEDFFEVHMYRLPELMNCSLIEEEAINFNVSSANDKFVHLDLQVLRDIDLLEYIRTDDEEVDSLIKLWVLQRGPDTIRSYLTASQDLEYSLSLVEQIDHACIHFLFYRALAIRQDLQLGLSLSQLATASSNIRDHYARTLSAAVQTYRKSVRQGQLLCPHSQVNFSFLQNRRFGITLYEESFLPASENGLTLEHIFGFIARNNSASLTVDMAKENADTYSRDWHQVRGLYLAHQHRQRDSVLKMVIRLQLPQVLRYGEQDQHEEFLSQNPQYPQKTQEMLDQYLSQLDTSHADDIELVCLQAVAAIGHRHSCAHSLISEMLRLDDEDTSVSGSDAALYATIRYVTDFLASQLKISSGSIS